MIYIFYGHISVAIVVMFPLPFLTLSLLSFLKTTLRFVNFIFPKNQVLVSLIFSLVYLFTILFISALIFVISFLLLILGLVWYSTYSFLRYKVRLHVWDLPFFLNVEIYHYKLSSWNCFCCILYLLVCCVFIYICKIFLNFIWSMLFNFHTFMNFLVFRSVAHKWSYSGECSVCALEMCILLLLDGMFCICLFGPFGLRPNSMLLYWFSVRMIYPLLKVEY